MSVNYFLLNIDGRARADNLGERMDGFRALAKSEISGIDGLARIGKDG